MTFFSDIVFTKTLDSFLERWINRTSRSYQLFYFLEMNKQLLRLSQIVLITSLTSLMSFAQSNFNGPVYELKVNGLESGADFKNLVTLVRNSPNVDYCRVANEEDGLVIQTKEDMTYEELSALISETGFSIKGDVVTSKGVRMRSNVEIAQPEQNEER